MDIETLAQNVVRAPEVGKCGLKYVIHISGGPGCTSGNQTYTEQWDYADMVSNLNFDA